jgi:serine O-acetyltransferase
MAEDRLTQDFDAHVLFTFAEIPDSPPLANRWARLKRWFLIAFVESWLAIFLFRTKVRLREAKVPFFPGLCDMLARVLFRVQIGDKVEAGPGLMITHGNVVIDGRTKIGRRCQINPWVTIGLSNSKKLGFSIDGPTIGDYVHIGTGAKVLGPITIGDYARIGANAVVVHDVPPNVTVVGARPRRAAEARISGRRRRLRATSGSSRPCAWRSRLPAAPSVAEVARGHAHRLVRNRLRRPARATQSREGRLDLPDAVAATGGGIAAGDRGPWNGACRHQRDAAAPPCDRGEVST